MLFNYFFLLPENYLLFSIFFIFCYLVLNLFSNKSNFIRQDNFIIYLAVIILLNTLILHCVMYSYNFGFKDLLYKDDTTNGFCIINIVIALLYLVGFSNMLRVYNINSFEFIILILLSVYSINMLVCSVNLISFYLLIELQSICFYTLAAFSRKNKYSIEAGLKYFILGSFSSVLLLFGISILYGFSGLLYYEDISMFFVNFNNIEASSKLYNIYILSIAFMLTGMLFKLYSFPFHFWVSDIYQGSPFLSTVFFSIFPFISLFYIFMKLYINIFIFFYESFVIFFMISSIGSMVVGMLGAIQQKKIRRLIAYSSITGTGYYLIIFVAPDFHIIKHIFFFIIVYTINVFGIFLCFSNLVTLNGRINIERFISLGGLYRYNKYLSLCIILLLFSIAGLPPFPTFLAKLYLLFDLYNYKLYLFMFFIIITTIISFYYYLRISKIILYNNISHWIYLRNIPYIPMLLIIYILFFNICLIIKPSSLLNIIEYILIDSF